MEIRVAREEDLKAINLIYNQAVHQRFCTAHLEMVSMEDRKRWFAARDLDRYPVSVAPDHGFSVLIAILLDKNVASIALLRKFGFEEWGRMPGIAKIEKQVADHLYYGLRL